MNKRLQWEPLLNGRSFTCPTKNWLELAGFFLKPEPEPVKNQNCWTLTDSASYCISFILKC